MNSILTHVNLRLLTLALAISLPLMVRSADYLSPELRQQVEALKSEFRASPTTTANYRDRAMVAWQWLNAYSLTGSGLPVNITATIRPNPPSELTRRVAMGLDAYLKELTLLDEHPDAIGELVAETGPFEARSWVTLNQQYRVGERIVETGGGFLIARHFMPGYGVYQVKDPAADNYISIRSSNPEVSFTADQAPLGGMHGGFRRPIPTLVFRVESGTLQPGDQVTITYGDKSGGSRGFLMSSASTDFLPIPLYIRFNGDDQFYSLPIQPVRITGSDIAGVHGFAPSVLRPGEKFALSVRAEDRFYNRARGPIPAFKVFANGKLIAGTQASQNAITVLEGLSIQEPGAYQITIKSEDGAISGEGNPILVSSDARKVYWGDTHGHSGFAEGIGTPERFMQWAKDDARLDFVTHSEHDIWLDDREWQVLIDVVKKYSEPGRFVGYLGYEWTTRNQFGGHHNVLFRDVDNRNRVGTQFYPTLSKLYAGLRANYDTNDVLVIPHAHQAGDYRQNDPELENLVEIMSQHGTFEWFGRMYLSHGHRVGFIAASDNHLSQPGYTRAKGASLAQRGGLAAVRAKENSRESIFDAMKSLDTYATTGDKIILDFRLNGAGMGQQAEFSTSRAIQGRVIGSAPIDSITLIKNDQQIWQKDYLTIDSGRFSKLETFYVTFESDSFPMHTHDNPRGGHVWAGSLELFGADIVDFEATDHFSTERNRLERDFVNPRMLHFTTASRGDASSIKLQLKNIVRNARIKFRFDAAREVGGGPPIYRKPALIPASEMTLSFKKMTDGKTHGTIPIDVYEDTVTLRRAVQQGDRDIEFHFEDNDGVNGDYYFVRVKQANDAMAWSSPIWVGSHPSR